MNPNLKKKSKITVPGHMVAPAERFGALRVTKNHGVFKGTVLEKIKKICLTCLKSKETKNLHCILGCFS